MTLYLFRFPAGQLRRACRCRELALALSATPLNPFRVNWPGHLRIFDAPQLKIVLRTNCQSWKIYAGGLAASIQLVLMCSCAAVQGAALPTPKKLRENPTASLLGPSPLPREESIFNTTLPSASTCSESIHMPKEKPESYTESIATTEGLPCPVVQLQPDTKARACA